MGWQDTAGWEGTPEQAAAAGGGASVAADAGVINLLTATPSHSAVSGASWSGTDLSVDAVGTLDNSPDDCSGLWYFRLTDPSGAELDTTDDLVVSLNLELDAANLPTAGDDVALFLGLLGAAGATPDVATDKIKSALLRLGQSAGPGDTVNFEIADNLTAQAGGSGRANIREVTIDFCLRGQRIYGAKLLRRDTTGWASSIEVNNGTVLDLGGVRDLYIIVALGRHVAGGSTSTFKLTSLTATVARRKVAA